MSLKYLSEVAAEQSDMEGWHIGLERLGCLAERQRD